MSISLQAIAFNHEPGTATSGLNIRRNFTTAVTVPEWLPGMRLAQESLAAYAAGETAGSDLEILVGLHSTEPRARHIEVRAVDPALDALPAATDPIVREQRRARVGNVLGEVAPKRLTIAAGTSVAEPFSLTHVLLRQRGVGVQNITWRWELRVQADPHWRRFAETTHRVYTVLEVPTAPWLSQPFVPANTQLPWTEVLEHACRWAASARTLDEAAARVTAAVFELGARSIRYGCPVLGVTQYAWPYFFCSEFLERLAGQPGRGAFVNCTDCATIVSTFANSLGCDLWQAQMFGTAPFALNPTIAIGVPGWRTACGWTTFNYHEVAWKGSCTADDEVFDACLLVDADPNPTFSPHTGLLPVNIRFGESGQGTYRDKLATPAGRANCQPQPLSRQRRVVV